MFVFDTFGNYELPGRGTVHFVECPQDCSDFDFLIGQEVLVDGRPIRVAAVERFLHAPPWHKGERIGLLEKTPSDGIRRAR